MADTDTRFLVHLTTEGERWDLLAWRYYRDPCGYGPIVRANPQVPIVPVLPGGLRLLVPVLTPAPATPAGLPPWKRS